ncbi:adenosylcobinamide-GDP ribazoletransferase [Intrasporangium calvum]|uniref:Adenosylcobinamide-GDP ribazoletransferase n=1 Tax=Intrasporangium calvum TaxID=53358 RepID=A0ABT5GJH3_9MICO|nr:adenosylcobinamide-GDP ribazoletransferase [Intrasporangium calvum]MDC5698397.1 adenosylcobinamide-GDP ribazoletransferase [Intrasporangium calvum]
MRDAWRLSAGTFLVVPVRPPSRIDRSVAAGAMVLAPVTALLAGTLWAGLGLAVTIGWLAPPVAAVVALIGAALLSRAMHLDGLADVADGLSSGLDRSRALEVMKKGDTGPAGAAALVLVLLLQAAALASLLTSVPGTALAVISLVSSRLAPVVACRHGVPAARPGGLGAAVAGTVRPLGLLAAVGGVVLAGLGALVLLDAMPYAAGLVPGGALLGAWLVTRHAVRRFGGITGDVIGAAMEISLAAALVAASSLVATL